MRGPAENHTFVRPEEKTTPPAQPPQAGGTVEDLHLLRNIRRARAAARRAGRNSEHIDPLAEHDLIAPVSASDSETSAGADRPSACADGASDACPTPLPRIDGYLLLGEVGSGGQATVFRGVQESTGRPVAVKVLNDGVYATSRGRTRFEREARILAALDHPNIVGIVDRGRTFDGAFFIVMPFVEGEGLGEYLERRSREPAPAIVALLREVVDAVAEAHRLGFVHRDLKPSNIRVDASGRPRVLDFGLARLLDSDHADAPTVTSVPVEVTQTGQIVGSLPWLSPEQAAGAASQLDFRSDVYALGLLLYFALTGQLPYPTAAPVRDVLHNIQNAAVVPASQIVPARRISPGLDRIILKALSKDPLRRYPSAVELAADLDAHASGRVATVRPRWQPSPLALTMAALVTTGALITAASLAFSGRRSLWAHPASTAVVSPANAGATDARPPLGDSALPPTTPPPPELVDSVGLAFVRVLPGEFVMGSPDAEGQREDWERAHKVTISHAFLMSDAEITQGQFERVTGRKRWNPQFDDPALPADDIRFEDAVEFCRRLGETEHRTYRLPTEAEWEYACRAGSTHPFPGTLDAMGWYAGNSGGLLHPGKLKRPNAWGLYDMHGNVAEWCSDFFGDFAAEPAVDPKGPLFNPQRLVRGGSFDHDWQFCRSATRLPRDPRSGGHGIGFRVVREIP